MGKRYDWEVTPQNTPRFKERRILFVLAIGIFVFNLLCAAFFLSDSMLWLLGATLFTILFAVTHCFDPRAEMWTWGYIIFWIVFSFTASAVLFVWHKAYWWFIGYVIELFLFALAAVLMLRRFSAQDTRQSKNRKQVIVRMRKSHRIGVITISMLLIVGALASMIVLVSLSEMELWIEILLCAAPVVPMMIILLYYASWQITFDASGIHKRLFWINAGSHSWSQVNEVRSAWSYTDQEVISILFNDGKTLRFRMICENAYKARQLILSHHSIRG